MKLFGVTTSFNCEELVPYVMKYVSSLGYDKFIVYDNESTDKTVELLKQYSFVEVRSWHCDNFTEEEKIRKLSEGFWSLYDENIREKGAYIKDVTEQMWCTLTDFDEVIYFPIFDYITLKVYLQRLSWLKYTVFTERMLNLISDYPPYDTNKFAHLQVEKCTYGDAYDWHKPVLFRMDNIKKILINPGQHCIGFKYFDNEVKQISNTRNVHVFHLKYLLGLSYLKERRKRFEGKKYFNGDDNFMTNEIQVFNRYKENAIPIQDYFSYKMLFGIEPGENDALYSAYEL